MGLVPVAEMPGNLARRVLHSRGRQQSLRQPARLPKGRPFLPFSLRRTLSILLASICVNYTSQVHFGVTSHYSSVGTATGNTSTTPAQNIDGRLAQSQSRRPAGNRNQTEPIPATATSSSSSAVVPTSRGQRSVRSQTAPGSVRQQHGGHPWITELDIRVPRTTHDLVGEDVQMTELLDAIPLRN